MLPPPPLYRRCAEEVSTTARTLCRCGCRAEPAKTAERVTRTGCPQRTLASGHASRTPAGTLAAGHAWPRGMEWPLCSARPPLSITTTTAATTAYTTTAHRSSLPPPLPPPPHRRRPSTPPPPPPQTTHHHHHRPVDFTLTAATASVARCGRKGSRESVLWQGIDRTARYPPQQRMSVQRRRRGRKYGTLR